MHHRINIWISQTDGRAEAADPPPAPPPAPPWPPIPRHRKMAKRSGLTVKEEGEKKRKKKPPYQADVTHIQHVG